MPRQKRSAPDSSRGASTIRDVAREAGVSTAMVSRVLNGVGTVDAALTERVGAACATLQYQPNRAALLLASGRSVIVGLLVPDIRVSCFMEIVRGAEYSDPGILDSERGWR